MFGQASPNQGHDESTQPDDERRTQQATVLLKVLGITNECGLYSI